VSPPTPRGQRGLDGEHFHSTHLPVSRRGRFGRTKLAHVLPTGREQRIGREGFDRADYSLREVARRERLLFR